MTDNASEHSAADVTHRLALTSVRLFVVLLRQETGYRNRTPEELSGPDELSEIARKSGGEILTAAAWHGDQVALSANSEGEVEKVKKPSHAFTKRFFTTICWRLSFLSSLLRTNAGN